MDRHPSSSSTSSASSSASLPNNNNNSHSHSHSYSHSKSHSNSHSNSHYPQLPPLNLPPPSSFRSSHSSSHSHSNTSSSTLPPLSPGRFPPPSNYHPSLSPPSHHHSLPWPLRRSQHDMKPPLPPPPLPAPLHHDHYGHGQSRSHRDHHGHRYDNDNDNGSNNGNGNYTHHHSHHHDSSSANDARHHPPPPPPPPHSHSHSHPSLRSSSSSSQQRPPPPPAPQSKPSNDAIKDVDDGMPPTSDFVKKLYKMLQDNLFHDIVSWTSSGESFVIKDITEFTKSILPRMFKHSNFASFVRQLNKYDFHKVKNNDSDAASAHHTSYGDHAWTFKHPDFQANNRDALENIKRKVPSQRKAAATKSSSVASPSSVAPNASTPAPAATSPHTRTHTQTANNSAPSPASPANTTPGPQYPIAPSLSDSPIIQSMLSQIDHLNSTVRDLTTHIRNIEENYQSVLNEMVHFQRNMAQQDGLLQNLIQYFLQIENGKQAESVHADASASTSANVSTNTGGSGSASANPSGSREGKTLSSNNVPSSMSASTLENQFVPVSEAQRIMNGAYPETDIARASFEQMNEMARRANTAGMQFAVTTAGAPAPVLVPAPGTLTLGGPSSTSPSPPRNDLASLSKQDALQRIGQLSRARPSNDSMNPSRSRTSSPLPLSLSVLMDDHPSPSRPFPPSRRTHTHSTLNGNHNLTLGGVINSTIPRTDSSSSRVNRPSHTGETFPGLQVFTVGHLLPRSDNAPDDGTWSFDPTSLQLNLGGLGLNNNSNNGSGSIQPATTNSPMAMDVSDIDPSIDPSFQDMGVLQAAHATTSATTTSPLASRTTSTHPDPASASTSSSLTTTTTKPKVVSQRLRVRRSTFVPGWAVPPRVLLVEDDAVSRKLSTKFLQVFGCTTDIAIDGVAAVHKMNLEKYDLVLMDIVMPKLDGVSATSLIRQFDPMTPIISMTSNSNPSEILMYYSHGMNDILPKPFTRDGLFEMVEKHLMHLKSIQEMVYRPQSLIDPYPFDRPNGTNRSARKAIGPAVASKSKSGADGLALTSGGSDEPSSSSATRSSARRPGTNTTRSRTRSSGGGGDDGDARMNGDDGPDEAPDDDEEEEEEEEEEDSNEVVPASRPPSDPLPPLPVQSLSLPSSSHNDLTSLSPNSEPEQPPITPLLPLQVFHPQPPMTSTDARINPLAGFRLSDEQYALILQNIVSASDFGFETGGMGTGTSAAFGGVGSISEVGVGGVSDVSGVPDSVPMPVPVPVSVPLGVVQDMSSSGSSSTSHSHPQSRSLPHADPRWEALGSMTGIDPAGGIMVNVNLDMNGEPTASRKGVNTDNSVNLGGRVNTENIDNNSPGHAAALYASTATTISTPTSHARRAGSGPGQQQVLGKRRERDMEREGDMGDMEMDIKELRKEGKGDPSSKSMSSNGGDELGESTSNSKRKSNVMNAKVVVVDGASSNSGSSGGGGGKRGRYE